MKTTMKLTGTRLPKLLSDLTHSNQFLKFFSIATLGLLALSLILVLVLVNRTPIVLALSPLGERLERTDFPKPEAEIKAAIHCYIDKRYKWQPENVKQRMSEALVFVLPVTQKAFQGAIAQVIKFATEKAVSQRVYPEKMEVNLDRKTVFVSGNRLTTFQNLKAAGNLRLELSFEYGPRTKGNPWGIYITKEREEL